MRAKRGPSVQGPPCEAVHIKDKDWPVPLDRANDGGSESAFVCSCWTRVLCAMSSWFLPAIRHDSVCLTLTVAVPRHRSSLPL